ncbi:MAG: TMEM43 family protein [Planctomycetes bacterium]|nr:TMEM43 family protein [Planctomycetota bacterium]
MADIFVERSSTGFLGNLGGSCVGVLLGPLFLLGAVILLWWTEGRTNLADVARKSVVLAPDRAAPELNDKLVALSGPLLTEEKLGDPGFLRPRPAIRLERAVEMYAWVEDEHSESRDKVGGGTERTTTYTYRQEWSRKPSSAGFRHPEGHQNPPAPVKDETWSASTANIGQYRFAPAEAELPAGQRLSLAPDDLAFGGAGAGGALEAAGAAAERMAPGMVEREPMRDRVAGAAASRPGVAPPVALLPAGTPAARFDSGYVFLGGGAVSAPRLGDVRLSYELLAPGLAVTLFGKLNGSTLAPFTYEGGSTFFRALPGGREQAIATLDTEHTVMTWILRGIGFVLIWIGLGAFFGPLVAVANILPIAGKLSRGLIGIVTGIVAFVLWAVLVIVSKVVHSPIALALVMVVVVVGGFMYLKKRAAAAGQRA